MTLGNAERGPRIWSGLLLTKSIDPLERTIVRLFEDQAARTPDDIAAISGDTRLTFRDLDTRSNRMARYLQCAGVGPESLVGLSVERSPEMLIAILAIIKSGGAYVPIDPSYPSARIAVIIQDSQLGFLLTKEKIRRTLPASSARLVSIDGDADAIAGQSPESVASFATGKNLAYVIYTSGSTGRPNGVMVENRNLVNSFEGTDHIIRDRSGVWLAVASISFDISVLELLWTLTRGFRLVIHGEGNLEKIPAEIIENNVTHLQSTPSLLRALVSAPRSLDAFRKLKAILIGGEVLQASLVDSLRQSFEGEIYNVYGPTETTIWSTFYRLEERRISIPIGKPILNTQVYVLDQELRPVAAGTTGELYIGGNGVARGYLNRPDLTAERFLSDPFRQGGRLYRSGDLALSLADGNIEFKGRADFQVKVHGFRVELGEIEATLERQPSVLHAVVLAREDLQAGKILVAYVVANTGKSIFTDSLRRALEAALPNYMVPSHFVLLTSLPLTANGKIDRNALPSVSLQSSISEDEGSNPRGEFERVLAKAWAEALGLSRVHRHDNFFSLGGHSLAALKIAFKCQQEFIVDFPLRTFSEYPVLSEQAKRLEEMVVEHADASVLERLMGEMMKERENSVSNIRGK
jgi:amino acid adenylation domain-containing protein